MNQDPHFAKIPGLKFEGPADREWAVVTQLRRDGSVELVPLTLALLDGWAERYFFDGTDNGGDWSTPAR